MAEAMEVVCDEDGRPSARSCTAYGCSTPGPLASTVRLGRFRNVARNIGIDSAWSGTYTPASKVTRAVVMIDRIEAHASAPALVPIRWRAAEHGATGMSQPLTSDFRAYG